MAGAGRVTAAGVAGLVLVASGFALPAAASQQTAAGRCTNGDVSAAYRSDGAGAGNRFGRIVLRNTSDEACTVRGYGGLSYAARDGGQVGAAATRTPGRVRTIVLQPGQRAVSEVDEVVAQNYPAAECRPTTVTFLRVHVPGATRSQLVRHRSVTCADADVQVMSHQPYARPQARPSGPLGTMTG